MSAFVHKAEVLRETPAVVSCSRKDTLFTNCQRLPYKLPSSLSRQHQREDLQLVTGDGGETKVDKNKSKQSQVTRK